MYCIEKIDAEHTRKAVCNQIDVVSKRQCRRSSFDTSRKVSLARAYREGSIFAMVCM